VKEREQSGKTEIPRRERRRRHEHSFRLRIRFLVEVLVPSNVLPRFTAKTSLCLVLWAWIFGIPRSIGVLLRVEFAPAVTVKCI
jgi:hypothetical protein